MMVIPIDYHMVHRGHDVFDTSIIFDGYLYELDVHINRFFRSTSKARIASPFTFSELKSLLIQLSAASKCRKGTLRYWLSAGPENFLLSPAKCSTSAFYVVVIDEDFAQCKEGKWQTPSADRTCKNHFKHNLHCQFSPMHNQPHHSRFR